MGDVGIHASSMIDTDRAGKRTGRVANCYAHTTVANVQPHQP
jgi:hypothetical protein